MTSTTTGILNNCFGVVLGFDAGFSGLWGIAFSGTMQDIEDGCKQMFPVFEAPPFGIQLGFVTGTSENPIPTFLMEFTLGLSASTGLPGYTACTTTVLGG